MRAISKIIILGLIFLFILGSVRTFPSSGGHGGTIYKGHEYKLFTSMKIWSDAKADCEAQGGHLVTITSFEENDFVSTLAGSNDIWIGLTDELNEGDWQWITGEMCNFTNWNSGEPNDAGAGEDYVEMLSDGSWNDAGPPGTPGESYYYVCEWDDIGAKTTFNGHEYQLINISKTWHEAKKDCEARGGHLVTITSSKENEFVSNLAGSFWIWIGLTDELNEGDWQWVTGESVTYDNWGLGEPNDASGEDYTEMHADGSWNDIGPPSSPDISYYYVCEWDIFLGSQNLILYLSMNEGSGTTVYDLSGNDNDGTVYGATWSTSGKFRDTLEFDGVDDYVEAPSPSMTSGQLSVSVWVYYNYTPDPSAGYSDGIICQDDFTSRIFQLSTIEGKFAWHRWTGIEDDVLSTNEIEAHRWYHVAVTFDGTTHRLYVDGILNDQQTGDIVFNETVQINIGRIGHGDGWAYFNGKIDEVRIYNRSLSTTEVKHLAGLSFYDNGDDTSDTTDEKDSTDEKDTNSMISPGFELVTWTASLFLIMTITKIVRKSKNTRKKGP
ncbi:MAG: lectin-like protein [Candidatus Hodarchaeota archaeon]